MGMGLAFKFALMISCMVAMIMGMYGAVTALSMAKDLENRIMLRGASQVRALALFGRLLIDRTKLDDKFDDRIISEKQKVKDAGEDPAIVTKEFTNLLGSSLYEDLR
ncbi:hypothetical protein ACFL01_04545, partial [Planctomycetota bacterium]